MSQYFDESPQVASAETEVVIDIGGSPLTLRTDRGVFSHGRDVNERARQLTASNADANGLTNVLVADPARVPPDVRFDLIWSNPPIRIGKPALHDLLSTWLRRLTPDGRAVLVVQKHLGADSLQRWLIAEGWPTTRLGSARGYRVLQVR